MIDTDLLLASGAVFKKLTKGELIFQEGAHCAFYHQLEIGRVKWLNHSEEGRVFVQTYVEPGECFGEIPLFDDHPYAASAVADQDSVVLRLCKSTFLQLLKNDQALHLRFTRLLAQRVRFKFLLLKAMSSYDPEERIGAVLDYMKSERVNLCTSCNQVKLTRQEIADMTGLRVETVIRSIRKLQDKGALVISKGKVYC